MTREPEFQENSQGQVNPSCRSSLAMMALGILVAALNCKKREYKLPAIARKNLKKGH